MKEKKALNESLLQFVFDNDIPNASIRLDQATPITSVKLLLPEIDISRMEICSCYIIGAYTATITLTNHLLERYCKELLILFDFGNIYMRSHSFTDDGPGPEISKYINKDLSETLKACKVKGLLSKEDWKLLDRYREIFRNGFSHYDPPKILQGAVYSITPINVDDTISEKQNIRYEDSPLRAIAIDQFAQYNAWRYFVTVENFIRSTIKYFHNRSVDPGLPIISFDQIIHN